MLALLKGGRAAATASASPVARAAAGRLQPPLSQTAAGRSQPLVSSAAAAQQVLSLHRRLLAMLRQQSRALLRLSVIQCEFVIIYRTRRTMQLFELYSGLYSREALREMLRAVRRLLAAQGRRLLLSAALVVGTEATPSPPPADGQKAETEKEAEQEQETGGADGDTEDADQPPPPARHGYEGEFERFAKLCKESIICPECGKRQVLDRQVEKIAYCACANGGPTAAVNRGPDATWEPFIERNHVVVWRQRHGQQDHLYSYKVYGTYDDVTAESFFEVQLNTEYRTQWDPSVMELRVVDPKPGDDGDVIYWQVKFPTMFQNRDYVFDRSYHVDRRARQMTIVSRCAARDDCPERPGVVRVNNYWSVMVIRPHTNFDQPGMDFGLTYFDDPGTYLPPVITNYVAATGLPNFLERVADAARTVHRQMVSGQVTVPLQFLERPPSEGPAASAAAPPPQQQRAATGRAEFTSYSARADFVPVGAA
ncbi:stAR-related lipid transfer protein 7, mitochondrial-like [Amphibalanus amphitrite]|uniref:stAR-related lipid transfer protein 7, mitochondrial-like n=1 Tax=Amphibalanus amphitrite TaxID=1232801 RepID=UPI001C8FA8D0|nr:stAR-related lipid transfer protein 7, mitochondrial-like [Amphibalanus amphitrite]XP_043189385.1 stAR-related lipid transfer protein 7, mitochondrial-like [Amphibalanus amphitrite]XP_043223113.1 stAR-related lipid transfer protein 7, mitochondrial-like [Amphibalanus amphitrite]XP_043223114.1 stAR-related lipid transfer protein 7, mitochondrial-like [Amphibalanus amphitrite]XP_043223116.1 stAR-related lipid transfer protein 7, mitochondrial-like [Amphibalanus amphitrite]XP_043223117.1 stAR-